MIGQPSDLRIEQAHVDMLSSAAAVALMQGAKDSNGCIHARHHVRNGYATFLGTATRPAIALSRYAHQTAHRLNHKIVSRPLTIGARLSKPVIEQ